MSDLILGMSLFTKPESGGGGFTPADLTSLELWYDASVTASITTTGTNVTGWADQSGNSRDLANVSGSAEPQYPGTSLNGISTVEFNNDYLEVSGFSIPQPYSYAIVVRVTDNGFARAIISTNGGSRSEVSQFNEAAPARFAVHCGTEQAISATTNDGSSFYILLGTNDGASSYGGVDGAPSALGGSPGTAGLSGFRMGRDAGGFRPHIGQTAEAIIWSNSYDSGEFASVLSYLQNKWAL